MSLIFTLFRLIRFPCSRSIISYSRFLRLFFYRNLFLNLFRCCLCRLYVLRLLFRYRLCCRRICFLCTGSACLLNDIDHILINSRHMALDLDTIFAKDCFDFIVAYIQLFCQFVYSQFRQKLHLHIFTQTHVFYDLFRKSFI